MPFAQRGSVLVAADASASAQFGSGVALSSSGTVMAVGAQNGNAQNGKVYIYDLIAGVWTQRGSVITAADGAIYDAFGWSVSLSDNGTVLAIGAPGWEGGASGQGGVYIYDWTTVWTQRGSVLTAADAAADDAFGTSVSLSANGAILAVGAPTWEGASADQGGVYLFDWTTVWTQRGSVLTSAVAGSYFGSAVSLSDTGAILAVGAQRFTSAFTLQGAAYVYDWTTVWTQRGSVIAASDAGQYDGFGSSINLTGSGTVLAVGASRWKNNDYKGRVYILDVSGSAWTPRINFSGADSVSSDNYGSGIAFSGDGAILAAGALGWEGAAADQGGVYVYDDPVFIGGPTLLTVVYPVEISIAAPTNLSVTATGTLAAATLLAVIDSTAPATGANIWTARCLIDGVDVSSRLDGTASVTADEGAARIASITLLPASGVIAPLDYVGKTITLDYVVELGGVEVARRLFTGRVDTPEYDPASTLLHLACVDDLQNRVSVLSRSVITGLVGGRYTEAVQGEILDNWDYAEARLSTVAASLDAGASGGLRVTPWELATTWATYTEAELKYERVRLAMPQRSTLTNTVTIEFDYRYPRLRERHTWVGWSGTLIDMRPSGYAYPTQQDILGAAGGSGWQVTLGVFWPAPASIVHSSGGFIYPKDGSIDMAILALTQRHSQTVTESFVLFVDAPESVALNGELPHALRGALASAYDGGAWESALDVEPLMPDGGEQDYAPDAPRGDADYAIQTLLDQARTRILGSHRGARVANAVLCNPDLDVDKRVAIATAMVAASGKVASVTHLLNFATGSATSEFELAVFGVGGAGIITPDTLSPPGAPSPAVATQDWPNSIPHLSSNTYGVTPYQPGLMGLLLNPPESIYVENIPPSSESKSFPNPYYVAGSYPVAGFRVKMPGVDDADRNPLAKTSSASYSIIVPADPLTFTVP